jgi:site-specific DNA recombinase
MNHNPPKSARFLRVSSYVTFERNQTRLQESARAPARKDLSADFPLRGFVACGDCSKPMTACWSKSKTGKKHPYYLCFTKGCESHRKSIPRAELEGRFETIVKSLQPSEKLFGLIKAMFEDAWNQRLAQAKHHAQAAQKAVKALDKKLDVLKDRMIDAEEPSVISAYEKRIAKLEKERALQAENSTERLARSAPSRKCSNSPCSSCQTLGTIGKMMIRCCGEHC